MAQYRSYYFTIYCYSITVTDIAFRFHRLDWVYRSKTAACAVRWWPRFSLSVTLCVLDNTLTVWPTDFKLRKDKDGWISALINAAPQARAKGQCTQHGTLNQMISQSIFFPVCSAEAWKFSHMLQISCMTDYSSATLFLTEAKRLKRSSQTKFTAMEHLWRNQ